MHTYSKCPVCENSLDGKEMFCPNCGFELRLFPQNVPDSVKVQENTRIEKARNNWSTILQLKTNVESENKKVLELEKKDDDNKQLLAQKEGEIDAQKQKVVDLQNQLKETEKNVDDLKSKMASLRKEDEKKDSKIDSLTKELEKSKNTIKEQEKSIAALNLKIRSIESKPQNPVVIERKNVGHLVMQLFDGEISAVFPVFVGKNVYGTNPIAKPGVIPHQISFICDDLMPEHFAITVNEDGESITAQLLSGSWSINNYGNHPSSKELQPSDEIIFQKFKLIYC